MAARAAQVLADSRAAAAQLRLADRASMVAAVEAATLAQLSEERANWAEERKSLESKLRRAAANIKSGAALLASAKRDKELAESKAAKLEGEAAELGDALAVQSAGAESSANAVSEASALLEDATKRHMGAFNC